jgi:hypothetical protein
VLLLLHHLQLLLLHLLQRLLVMHPLLRHLKPML